MCAQSWHSWHSCVRFETKASVWTFLSLEFKWRNLQNADKFCGRACKLWILWYARIFWQFKSYFFPSLLFHDLKKNRRWQTFNIRNHNIEIIPSNFPTEKPGLFINSGQTKILRIFFVNRTCHYSDGWSLVCIRVKLKNDDIFNIIDCAYRESNGLLTALNQGRTRAPPWEAEGGHPWGRLF